MPRADVARGIAIVEGIGGQLFLAVLVGRPCWPHLAKLPNGTPTRSVARKLDV